jgi:hypothetical protein
MDSGNASKVELEAEARRWTDAELHRLFSDYYNKLPGVCPVCGHEVSMRMDHKDNVTLLTIRCWGCGNLSTVLN